MWMSSCSFRSSCSRSPSCARSTKANPSKLFNYWLHVFQRLLPVATVVIASTTIASFFVLAPQLRWSQMMQDATSSLFYYQNWNLAFSSVDYYAQNAAAKSPFQHFW